MSYILDALKKSEQERKKGQVPGLGTLQGIPGPGGRFETDRLIWMYGLATILLLVALGLGAWLFMREPTPAPRQALPVATAQPPAAGKEAGPPPSRAAVKTPPAPTPPEAGRQPPPQPPTAGTIPPEGAAPPPQPAPTPVIEKPQPAPAQVNATSPENPFSDEKGQEESAAPVKPELLPTVPFQELPDETRAEMPTIKIGVHLFSDTPAARRASINGRLMREGQAVEKDLLLLEITRQGAIFSFRGRKFSLPVFPR